jgi:tRNA A37 threonylcarbamoyladenosine biosynthesis protein TsaE
LRRLWTPPRPDEVTSPTFTLIHEYDGARDGKPVKLFHLDVYRLEGERQLETLGLDELLTPDALVLVEWGEKFKSIRKKATGEIAITSDRRRRAQDHGDAERLSLRFGHEPARAPFVNQYITKVTAKGHGKYGAC